MDMWFHLVMFMLFCSWSDIYVGAYVSIYIYIYRYIHTHMHLICIQINLFIYIYIHRKTKDLWVFDGIWWISWLREAPPKIDPVQGAVNALFYQGSALSTKTESEECREPETLLDHGERIPPGHRSYTWSAKSVYGTFWSPSILWGYNWDLIGPTGD